MQINPENPKLESEIQDLERRLAEKREALLRLGTKKHEKEIIHETLAEDISRHVPEHSPKSYVLTQSDDDSTSSGTADIDDDIPSYEDPELKDDVRELVAYAFAENIEKATKKAAATGSPALIDAFHDCLVDELYDYMIQKGTIEKPE
jgi:hypothetical protein